MSEGTSTPDDTVTVAKAAKAIAAIRAPVPKGFPGRVNFVKSAAKLNQAPHSVLAEVCICGRSNVGKSSLINVLTQRRQLARVSQTPGRTRLINFFNIQDRLMLVDLPGYGWAKVPKTMQFEWGKSIQSYLASRPQLRLALLLLDIRRDPSEQDKDLYAWFSANDRPCLLLATKSDKLSSSKRGPRRKAIAQAMGVATRDVVACSATSKLGVEDIWSILLGHAAVYDASVAAVGSAPAADAEAATDDDA